MDAIVKVDWYARLQVVMCCGALGLIGMVVAGVF